MGQISSASQHTPIAFQRKEPRSSLLVMLSDYSADASWRLTIHVETSDGGSFCLGAVDTIPPNLSRQRVLNRVVAVASVPGAQQWRVFAELLAGTPQNNNSEVLGELKLGSCEEYAAGCCQLSAIPGNSVELGGPEQSPTGAPTPSGRITLYSGPGFALAVDAAYLGAGMAPAFLQQHDAGAGQPIGDGTMIGIGYPFLLPASQTLLLQWDPGRRFRRGFTVALSTAQNTYVASAETISAFGQWSVGQ